MWSYEKRLQYPVNIKTPNAKIAKFIITQFGGAYGNNPQSMSNINKCLCFQFFLYIQFF
jgi:spore coat protein JC